MASSVSTLYPPLVDTFMPAFARNRAMEITFALSPYNTIDNIEKVHVSIVDQSNNESLFRRTVFPSGLSTTNINNLTATTDLSYAIIDNIFVTSIGNSDYITYNEQTDLYTIRFSPNTSLFSVLDDDKFFEKYYKVQIRFDNSLKSINSTDYMIDQRPYFSEWSSICLVKPIEEIDIQLNGKSFARAAEKKENFIPSFTQGMISISGRIVSKEVEGKTPSEKLSYYQMSLYDNIEVIDDTGILNPDKDDPWCLDCLLNADNAIPGNTYTLRVLAVTKNNFVMVKEQEISIANFEDEYVFNPNIIVAENSEDGYVSIHVKAINVGDEIAKTAPGRLYIRRASSLDNFKNWEILTYAEVPSSVDVNTTFVDTTVASMVSYQYAAQFQFIKGTWSKTTRSKIIFPTFYDILLNRGNTQLAIRYNGQLSSMKPVVNRAKFDTLGNKYPKFAENAQLNYKQYSISGLISAEGDFNRKFMSEVEDKYSVDMANYADAFGETYMIRNDSLADSIQETGLVLNSELEDVNFHSDPRACTLRNTTHDVYPHENWFWERTFREKVVEWLNDGEPKLFKSMPEGNMIVMLTDISLTPNQNIGRMLYNFTGTMYEIGDGYSLKSLDAAGIISIPKITGEDLFDENEDKIENNKIISLRQIKITGEDEAIELLVKQINDSYVGVYSDRQVKPDSLKIQKVKLEFTSKPQYMTTGLEKYVIPEPGNNIETSKPEFFGYAIKEFCACSNHDSNTNYQNLFVGSNGVYSFPSDLILKRLKITEDSSALVTAIVEYEEEIRTDLIPRETYKEETIVGQAKGLFIVNKPLGEEIRRKYEIKGYTNNKLAFTQRMKNWSNVSFDVTPYSVVDILFKEDSQPTEILIGRSGTYRLEPYAAVDEITFLGRRMFLSESAGSQLDPWEYRIAQENEPEPCRNTVYIRENETVIWFEGKEYPFNLETQIAEIPVEGYVNYLGDIVRSEYY